MRSREDAIKFCLTIRNTYEDYPFSDFNWTIMRSSENKKMFAAIFEYQGNIRINVKCEPELAELLRNAYPSVLPAYHMNKKHWNSIILDGTVPDEEIKNMILDSFELIKPKKSVKKASSRAKKVD